MKERRKNRLTNIMSIKNVGVASFFGGQGYFISF